MRVTRVMCRALETRRLRLDRADQLIIIRTDRLGDLVVTLPALAELRRRYPEKRLILVGGVGNSSLGEIVRQWHLVDEVWEACDGVYGVQSGDRVVPSVKTRLRQLSNRPSVVYFLTPSLGAVLYARFLGQQVRTRVSTNVAGSVHEGAVVRSTLGISDDAESVIDSRQEVPRQPYAVSRYCVVHLNAHPLRSWPASGWIDLVRRIIERDYDVYLVGDHSLDTLAQVVVQAQPSRVRNAIGETSMEELVSLLRHACAVIGTDSGVMHLAGYLGVATFALFGPSLPVQWRPLGPEVTVFYQPRPCSPCTLTTCPYPAGARCLDDISVSEVWDRLARVLPS